MPLGKNLKTQSKAGVGSKDANKPPMPANEEDKSAISEAQSKPSQIQKPNKRSKGLRRKRQLQETDERVNKMMLIVFRIGTEDYALSMDQVQEVVKMPKIARIPQTPEYIEGVGNIRGNVYAILNLAARFGLQANEDSSESEHRYAIVIQSEVYKMAVAIDDVPDTIIIDQDEIGSAAHIVKHSVHDDIYIKGVVKKGQKLIIFIDITEMIGSKRNQILAGREK